jgi:hypothetical protein
LYSNRRSVTACLKSNDHDDATTGTNVDADTNTYAIANTNRYSDYATHT